MARKSLLLWALLICTLSGSTPATADDASLASDWQLFNRDAVEGRPSKETVRMMVFDAYDGQQQDSRDVTYGDDVIHIESADGLDRFNGHGYRTLPRAVQDLKRTDGATYYSEPLPLQGQFSILLSYTLLYSLSVADETYQKLLLLKLLAINQLFLVF